MRESLIEADFTYKWNLAGGEIRKVKWIGRRGAPDRVAMAPEAVIFWPEFKATGEKPEPHQLREHARMARMGQIVEIIDSIELNDKIIAKYLKNTIDS